MPKRLINLPNILTTLRILLLPVLALLVRQHAGIAACVILVVAGITDVLDGYLARQMKLETAVGKLLDPVADKILLCVAVVFLLSVHVENFGPTLTTLLLAREFLITGLRAMAAAEGLVISAGQTGKLKTLLQFIGLGFLMTSIEVSGYHYAQIGAAILWMSVVLSYLSMWQYLMQAYHELKSKLMS